MLSFANLLILSYNIFMPDMDGRFEIVFKSCSRNCACVCGHGMEMPLGQFSLAAVADRVCIITEENPPECFSRILERLFPKPKNKLFYRLPHSENAKNLAEIEKLCIFLYENGFSQNSVIIAAGGGAITDSAGFAASVYMRGIRWISVPTTFLGQIDAGIGGKTGVDLRQDGMIRGKNIIGTFWQPAVIVLETEFLESLPPEELRSGTGELAKYALLMQPEEGRAIVNAIPGVLAGQPQALGLCVQICAAMKARIAARDERDIYGIREKLNLGHTAGHAFETMSGGRLPHGIAVACGLKFAIILSSEKEILPKETAAEMLALLSMLGLPPLELKEADFSRFSELVSHDKKNRGAKNRFLLPKAFGIIETAEDIPDSLLKKAYIRTISGA